MPPAHFTENRRWRSQILRANRFLALGRGTLALAELEARVVLLASSTIFAGIDLANLAALASMFVERTVTAGTVLCRAGDRANDTWLIREGALQVFTDDAVAAVTTLGPGALTGEYGMFRDSARTATLQALGTTRLLALDYARFERFLHAFPHAMLALLKVALSR